MIQESLGEKQLLQVALEFILKSHSSGRAQPGFHPGCLGQVLLTTMLSWLSFIIPSFGWASCSGHLIKHEPSPQYYTIKMNATFLINYSDIFGVKCFLFGSNQKQVGPVLCSTLNTRFAKSWQPLLSMAVQKNNETMQILTQICARNGAAYQSIY